MAHFTRDQLTYAFDPTIPPVGTIRPGETLTVETYDTSTGRIHKPEDVPEFVRVRDPKKVNPACGPFFVEGAEPGDALAVEILDISLAPLGWVRVLGGAGVIQDGLTENGIVMVGVIGTAPAEGTVYTAHPGPQGSNMDYTAVAVGARVYLPVHVPGALLAIGDVHASMGAGEVSGTGVEINGEVTVRVELLKGAAPARPWIETPDAWIATGQGVTLDDAVGEAVEGLTRTLMDRFELDRTEAFLLVSARGDVRIGQCARIKGCDATAFAKF